MNDPLPASLRAPASLLAGILDALDSSVIVAVTDRAGAIVYANRQFCHVSGYTAEELLGSNHRILNSGVHPRSFWRDMYAAVAQGGVWRSEVCNRNKSGGLYWVDTAITAIRDDAGAITHLLAVRVDITARKAAEAASRESHERLELMVAASRAGLWDATLTPKDPLAPSRPWYWSPQVRELLGVTPAEFPDLLGSWIDRLHPDDRDSALDTLNDHLNRRGPFDVAYRLRHADGTWRWFHSRAQALWNHAGVPTRVSGSLEDINQYIESIKERARANERLRSAKRRLEKRARLLAARTRELDRSRLEAEAASRAKSDFLANMSHEIRTPLTAVMGFSEVIDDPTVPAAERTDAIERIRRNSTHLMAIINDILDLSKIEAGRMTLESIAVDPLQIAREVVSLLEGRAAGRRLDLHIEAPESVPTIQSDPVRLRQILLNLVGNAIKFTESGSVVITLHQRRDESAPLQIDVADTGIGIPADQLGRIFQPFTQADASSTRRFGGTGLGLSISSRLATMLGGSLNATSTPGAGSVFTLSVAPLPAAAPGPQTMQPAAQSTRAPGLAGVRILLVDDCIDNQRLFSFVLSRAGANVEVANDGFDAIERVTDAMRRSTPYDVILMDSQMPECDGPTATRRLRAMGYRHPIAALTADCLPAAREQCIEAGYDDYAVKPIPVPALVELCRRLADRERGQSLAA